MCGIAGTVSFGMPPDAAVVKRMCDAISHRGPDDSGIFARDSVALGHRRLSIIDLANGHQPLANEDATIWIVFNGEIYNCLELRRELEDRGHLFRTHCDTEVIVHLYEEYGDECVKKLSGMFAFAIYDGKLGRLFLARDRMGQKPLFYFKTAGCFVFASELGALKQHQAMPREYNLQALHDYFSLQYVPSPFTVYREVFKFPPAHCMEIDLQTGRLSIDNYWRPDFSLKTGLNFKDASAKLRELLTGAVKKRLMSDVPFGAFLSGGLDSSIIVGIMARLCDQPVKTFTVGFRERLYDERDYALMASHAINKYAKHPVMYHEKIVDPDDFEVLVKLVRHYGEPFSDASMLPTFLLSGFTREHVKVVLSGDGADELFAGYERYLVMKYAAVADILPAGLRRRMVKILGSILPAHTEERGLSGRIQRTLGVIGDDKNRRYLGIINRFPHDLKLSVYGERFRDEMPDTLMTLNSIRDCGTAVNRIEKLLETDLHSYLPGDILTKVDIASMACSLELRSPFMDHELVEFAASLPLSYKQKGRSRKHILKAAFADLLPQTLLERGKKGFGVPVAAWFRGGWKNILEEKLLEGMAVKNGFLRRERLEELISRHCGSKADYSYALWSMLIFELFLEQE